MRRYPRVIEAMASRHIGYNKALEYLQQQEQAGTVFAIYPDEKLPIGHIENNPHVMRQVYNLGVTKAEQILPALRHWLNPNSPMFW